LSAGDDQPRKPATGTLDQKSGPRNGKNALETGQTPSFYSILILAMTKRKPATFSVTKAVKANARERVGQPPPARVLESEPRTGRDSKHKPTLEETIRQE
jgi:hypothetical protein